MKIVIFAGGTGRRLWPISRQKTPKQFEPLIGDKSTLRLAVDRVLDRYGAENIYISTNERYLDILQRQLPELPAGHLIGEPERRDLAPAVGLAMAHLAKAADPETLDSEPVAILWGDNTMENVSNFREVLSAAEQLIRQREEDLLFIGETPRFANDNLGWIGLGQELGRVGGLPFYRFDSLTYRPPLEECQRMFEEGSHVWNTGYFVTTVGFVQQLYQQLRPRMWQHLARIQSDIGEDNYQETLHRVYPQMEEISFDDAILHHVHPEQALVLHHEMGWSDPGTLYALKESINPDPAKNVTKGLVVDDESQDCLIYNYEDDKLVAAVGLEGMIVVNTGDALLVVHKDNMSLVKQVVNGLEETELESYT